MNTLAKSDQQYIIMQQQQQKIMMQMQQQSNPQMKMQSNPQMQMQSNPQMQMQQQFMNNMASNAPNANKFNRMMGNDAVASSPSLPLSPSDRILNNRNQNMNIIQPQMNMMVNYGLGSASSLPAPMYSSDENNGNERLIQSKPMNISGSVSASALMFDAMNKKKKLKKVKKKKYEFKQQPLLQQPSMEAQHPPINANYINNQPMPAWKQKKQLNSYQLQNQTIQEPVFPKLKSSEERMNREIQQQLAAMAEAENKLQIIDAYLPSSEIQRNRSDSYVRQGGNVMNAFNDMSKSALNQRSGSMKTRPSRKKAARKASSSVVSKNENKSMNELINKLNARKEKLRSSSVANYSGKVAGFQAVLPVGGSSALPVLMQSHSQNIRQIPNIADAYEMKSAKIGGTLAVIDGRAGGVTQQNVTLDVTPTATATATHKFFYDWNSFSILKWLNTIENGKFISFEYLNIKQAIKHSNMNGKEMLDLNDLTLRLLKMDEENDRQLILENIQQLQNNTSIGMSDVNINECVDAYLCVLSYKVMSDPVIVCVDGFTYGNTYEREVIVDYIQRFQVEPFTKEKLTLQMLVSNTMLKSVIERWKSNQ